MDVKAEDDGNEVVPEEERLVMEVMVDPSPEAGTPSGVDCCEPARGEGVGFNGLRLGGTERVLRDDEEEEEDEVLVIGLRPDPAAAAEPAAGRIGG